MRTTPSSEIVGTREHNGTDSTYAAGHKTRVSKRAHANSHVKALCDKIQIVVGKHQLYLDARVGVEKATD